MTCHFWKKNTITLKSCNYDKALIINTKRLESKNIIVEINYNKYLHFKNNYSRYVRKVI